MTFPVSAPERTSLVPVISMLLQFSAKELALVLKEPQWGQRPVTEVKRALNKINSSQPSSPLPISSPALLKTLSTKADSKVTGSPLDSCKPGVKDSEILTGTEVPGDNSNLFAKLEFENSPQNGLCSPPISPTSSSSKSYDDLALPSQTL
jgi:hypothetical protein